MALDKQSFPLSVVGGLDTKTDEKNVLPTNFTAVENLVYQKTGALRKKFGSAEETNDEVSASDLTNLQALTSYEKELLSYRNGTLYSKSEAYNAWKNIGPADQTVSEAEAVYANNKAIKACDVAQGDGLEMHVYLNFSTDGSETVLGTVGSLEAVLIDQKTRAVIQRYDVSSTANIKSVSVQFLQGSFFVFYANASNIQHRRIEASTRTMAAAVNIAAATATIVQTATSGFLIFCVYRGSTNFNLVSINFSGTVSSAVVVDTFSLVGNTELSINMEGQNVRLFWRGDAGGVKTTIYNSSLSQLLPPITTAAVPGPNLEFTSCAKSPTLSALLYNDLPAAHRLLKLEVNSSNTVTLTPTLIKTGCILRSKCIFFESKIYVVVEETQTVSSNIRPSVFALTDAGTVVSRLLIQNSLPTYKPSMLQVGSELYTVAAEFNEVNPSAAALLATSSLKKLKLNISTQANYFDTVLGNQLIISGSVAKMYDGFSISEIGFLQSPQIDTIAATYSHLTGITSTPAQTVVYVALFAWRDKFGQIHRSAPSNSLQIALSGANFARVSLTISTLKLSNKQDVFIEVYRASSLNSTLVKLPLTIQNDTSVEKVTVVDDVNEATLVTIAAEPIYTTGGVLENDAPAPSKYAVTYKNRVFLLASDGRSIYFSKLREPNGPVEFNLALQIQLDNKGGLGTALGVLDDHLIIFKERGVYALTGEGPNNLGEQDDYRQPYFVTSDAGCIEPNSIVQSPDGLLFKSEKGIYIISRGFQLGYIGAPVEKFNGLTICSANLIADTNEVRFNTIEGQTLVYDYFHKRWATFTNQQSVDAVNHEGTYYFGRATGQVYKEDPTRFDEAGSFVSSKLETAWIQLAGIQGFQRFYKMLVLGTYFGKHKLRISFAYDFAEHYVDDITIDAGAILGAPAYGSGTYGSGVYGGPENLYQFEIRPKLQKCQSFKVKIEDFETSEKSVLVSFSNFAIELGVKKGLNKNSNARTFGAS